MMIVVANQKGGVGKSTIAVHLAVWLHDKGFRVALVDADKQRSSSQWVSEAEKGITVRAVDSPDNCLASVQELSTQHEFIVGDGPGGIDDLSRAMLLLADLALLPISPSILDLRSVQQATAILRFAQAINGGRPAARIVLNKMKSRDTISRELVVASRDLGVEVAATLIRDLQAYRDAAQQGTTVTRMGMRAKHAAMEIELLFGSLLTEAGKKAPRVRETNSGLENEISHD